VGPFVDNLGTGQSPFNDERLASNGAPTARSSPAPRDPLQVRRDAPAQGCPGFSTRRTSSDKPKWASKSRPAGLSAREEAIREITNERPPPGGAASSRSISRFAQIVQAPEGTRGNPRQHVTSSSPSGQRVSSRGGAPGFASGKYLPYDPSGPCAAAESEARGIPSRRDEPTSWSGLGDIPQNDPRP